MTLKVWGRGGQRTLLMGDKTKWKWEKDGCRKNIDLVIG